MSRAPMWRRYLRLLGPDVRADVDDELTFHLEMRTRDLVARGMDPEAAGAEALRRFGDVRRFRRECEEMGEATVRWEGRREWWGRVVRDLRYAVRALRRSPGFALVAVLTLALGIGASTAIYSVLKGVVLDPLPYPHAERLVRLKNPVPGVAPGEEWNLASAQFFYLRNRAHAFEEIGAYSRQGLNLLTPLGPQRANGVMVTAGTLRLIGARPALGRIVDRADGAADAPPVAVLGHEFWQTQFGADPAAVGRTLNLDGRPVQIVGVMEPGVELPPERGAPSSFRTDVWIQYELDPAGPFYNNHVISMLARLRPGATAEQARNELNRLTAGLPEAYPQVYSSRFMERFGFRMGLYPLQEYVVGDLARSLWMLLGAVGLLLLIAWTNVANLFLARIEARRRELAIRSTLGADRWGIARHLLAESLILALAGGALGLVLSLWGVRSLVFLAPTSIPRLESIRLDGSAVAFALVLSLLVALGIAALAVARHGRPDRAGLSEGGRSVTAGRERQRIRSVLVAAQVAVALVLVVGAGLLIGSFQRLRSVEPGIEAEGVLTLQLHLPDRYRTGIEMGEVYASILERIRALPGVTAAGAGDVLPFSGGFGCTVQAFEDPRVIERLEEREETTCAGQAITTPGYLEALEIPLLSGRMLDEADGENPDRGGGVVVSRAFADRFWPGENPIGQGVNPNGMRGPPFFRVVGVVGDVYSSSLEEPPALAIYYPLLGRMNSLGLVVRTERREPTSLLPAIRRAVQQVDPDIPIANAEKMSVLEDRSMSRRSFTMILLGLAAGFALLLAAIGLYGVISYIVTRRTGEIGIRMALGALPRQVEWLVVGGFLRLVLLGIALGVVAALALTRTMQGLLYGVRATDPAAYLAAVVVLGAVALAASWLPARRAARVDPVEALRYE